MSLSLENVVGESIESISIKVWDKQKNGFDWIEQVIIKTATESLILTVNPDLDELTVSTDSIKKSESENEISINALRESSTLADLLGKKLVWTWILTNNQGYQDGFQLQVTNGKEETIIQFIAISSKIEILKLSRN
ncbi:DUF6334 family protein [Rufibacter aurantiacus]|uniref:DUF6334 family protein n=1 Tax=Rufibacter aurantiacus TaxID=2817374 RepID=UPI001B317938|nr:DUF6334 family protein [Rufibacter aurantiacus]